jgi:hypothetical protein
MQNRVFYNLPGGWGCPKGYSLYKAHLKIQTACIWMMSFQTSDKH